MMDWNTVYSCIATAVSVLILLWKSGMLKLPYAIPFVPSPEPVKEAEPAYGSTPAAIAALTSESLRLQRAAYDEAIAELRRRRDLLAEPEPKEEAKL